MNDNQKNNHDDILKILREIQESQKQTLKVLKGIKAGQTRMLKKLGISDDTLIIYEGEYWLPIGHQSTR